MYLHTSATGGAAGCVSGLSPAVGRLGVSMQLGVRGRLAGVGLLFNYVIVDDVTRVLILTWVGLANSLNWVCRGE